MNNEFFFQVNLTELVQSIISLINYVLEIVNNIVFTYNREDIEIEFSFWTFLVVTFILDIIAFCIMGIESRKSKS